MEIIKLSSYFTVVLYIGIMKVEEFWSKNIATKPANFFILTVGKYWLGISKPKNVFRSTINTSTKLVWNFDFLLTDWLIDWQTDWLTDKLMPSDKCNYTMAKAAGLISSLFNVTLSQVVSFTNCSSSNACIMILPKLSFALLCFASFSTTAKLTICGVHIMASVQDLWMCSASRGASYAIRCLECCLKCLK